MHSTSLVQNFHIISLYSTVFFDKILQVLSYTLIVLSTDRVPPLVQFSDKKSDYLPTQILCVGCVDMAKIKTK